MSDYIERAAVLDHLAKCADGYPYIEAPTDAMLAAVKAIPAADVVEVKHGRWRKAMGDSGVVRMACTNCGFYRFPENDVRERMFNYCPSCGAIMDGGQDDV